MTPPTASNNAVFQNKPPSSASETPSVLQRTLSQHELSISQPRAALLPPDIEPQVDLSPPRLTQRLPSRSARDEHGASNGLPELSLSPQAGSLSPEPQATTTEPRQIILSSFAPRVACYASADAEELIRLKGFSNGLHGLLRPFGERISGKVVIRESTGAGRAWEDFSIHCIEPVSLQQSERLNKGLDTEPTTSDAVMTNFPTEDNHVEGGRESNENRFPESYGTKNPVYATYLRDLLTNMVTVPYETFTHPVACIIAVSSHNQEPIGCLRQLYEKTTRNGGSLPAWLDTDCLRYYVLIHDEDKDDIAKSTALFDLMKRNFGLHCYLLRLKSSLSLQTDDDTIPFSVCGWVSDVETAEQQPLDALGNSDVEVTYIHESDATSIRGFVREMVTQSLVPFMEGRIAKWNDQVASKRRGISGRFASLSKRFAGFGSVRGSSPNPLTSSNSSSSNFDAREGFYKPDTSEAMMRQLADYAFMLRDWKLAYKTYDVLRVDFETDKAWAYYAAVNEMCAISILLAPQTLSSRISAETVDQMLDAALYSYLTRCSIRSRAIRCLTVAVELIRSRALPAAEYAARWGIRFLELGILHPLGQAFLSERIADCYHSYKGIGSLRIGSRKRQTAFWNLLSTRSWIAHGMDSRARNIYGIARSIYQQLGPPEYDMLLSKMNIFRDGVQEITRATSELDLLIGEVAIDSQEGMNSEMIDQPERVKPQDSDHFPNQSGQLASSSSIFDESIPKANNVR